MPGLMNNSKTSVTGTDGSERDVSYKTVEQLIICQVTDLKVQRQTGSQGKEEINAFLPDLANTCAVTLTTQWIICNLYKVYFGWSIKESTADR